MTELVPSGSSFQRKVTTNLSASLRLIFKISRDSLRRRLLKQGCINSCCSIAWGSVCVTRGSDRRIVLSAVLPIPIIQLSVQEWWHTKYHVSNWIWVNGLGLGSLSGALHRNGKPMLRSIRAAVRRHSLVSRRSYVVVAGGIFKSCPGSNAQVSLCSESGFGMFRTKLTVPQRPTDRSRCKHG